MTVFIPLQLMLNFFFKSEKGFRLGFILPTNKLQNVFVKAFEFLIKFAISFSVNFVSLLRMQEPLDQYGNEE